MSYHACEVSKSVRDVKIVRLKNANNAIRKLKSLKVTLNFYNFGGLEKSLVVCFSDAAVANLKNGRSQGAFIIFLYENKKYACIAWTSRTSKRIVESTLSVEAYTLYESLETCFIIKSLLVKSISKDNYQNIIPNCSYTDSKLLVNLTRTTKTLTEKRLQVDICIIKDIIEKRDVRQIT